MLGPCPAMVDPCPGRQGISRAVLGSALARRLCWGRSWPAWVWEYAEPMLLSSAGRVIAVSFTVLAMLCHTQAYWAMLVAPWPCWGHAYGPLKTYSYRQFGLVSHAGVVPACWGHAGLCWRQVGSYLDHISDILNT